MPTDRAHDTNDRVMEVGEDKKLLDRISEISGRYWKLLPRKNILTETKQDASIVIKMQQTRSIIQKAYTLLHGTNISHLHRQTPGEALGQLRTQRAQK